MKFDHLIHIYWTRYFLYGGRTFLFQLNFRSLRKLGGLGGEFWARIHRRLEYPLRRTVGEWGKPSDRSTRALLNVYFGSALNINGDIYRWELYNQKRLYLTKTYRGRALAMHKPVRGQRTWSNASVAKSKQSLFSNFISKLRQIRLAKLADFNRRSYQYRMSHKNTKVNKLYRKQRQLLPLNSALPYWF